MNRTEYEEEVIYLLERYFMCGKEAAIEMANENEYLIITSWRDKETTKLCADRIINKEIL
jgi:hypothetical protein